MDVVIRVYVKGDSPEAAMRKPAQASCQLPSSTVKSIASSFARPERESGDFEAHSICHQHLRNHNEATHSRCAVEDQHAC